MSRSDSADVHVEAPPGAAFAALLDPEALVEWLPPAGMTGTFAHFDARPGGSFRMTLTYDDPSEVSGKSTAESDVVDGRFIEIVPGTRVVQAGDFESDDPAFAGTMTMTWEIVPEGDGCRVSCRADDVPSGISAADHLAGIESSLSNLATYLEAK